MSVPRAAYKFPAAPPISSCPSDPRAHPHPSGAAAMNRARPDAPYPTASASMEAAALLPEPKLEYEAALPLSSPGPFVPLGQLMRGLDQPRPLDALLQGPQLPPFLSKTYDLVSEPALDGVISWGSAGNSLVVWDPSTFARDVLPYHFKHDNFSSFVRQLNTYGFRKVHADRWEFAHEDFLRDSKHSLKRIVRRRSSPTQQSSIQPASSPLESSLDPELHRLRTDKTALLQEVARLTQEHRQTIEHMRTLNQRLESAEDRQMKMISFLAKLLQDHIFVRQLKFHRERKEIDSTRVKRKFLKHVLHGSIESGESSSLHTGESGSHFAASSPMAVQDDIAHLRNFLLDDNDLNFGMNPENIGLEGVEAPEDIGALVQGLTAQDELGSGAELLAMPSASCPLGQDPTIGRYEGRNVLSPGLDAASSEAVGLGSLSENMGMLSGTMLETAADHELMWGMDTSAALQNSCSGSSQQSYISISDPYLMEIANRAEKF